MDWQRRYHRWVALCLDVRSTRAVYSVTLGGFVEPLSLAFVYECIYTKSEYEQIKQTGFDYQTLSWMNPILTDCPDDFDYEKDEPRKAGGVTKQLPRFLRFYGAKQIEPYFLSTGDSKSLAVLASDSFSISPSTLPVQINSRVWLDSFSYLCYNFGHQLQINLSKRTGSNVWKEKFYGELWPRLSRLWS